MKHVRILVLAFSTVSSVLAKNGCYKGGERAFSKELAAASLVSVCDHMLASTGSSSFNESSPSRTACRTYPSMEVSTDNAWYNDNRDKAWFFQIFIDPNNDNENGFNLKRADCVKEFEHAINLCDFGAIRKVGKLWRFRADPQYKRCEMEWSDSVTGEVIGLHKLNQPWKTKKKGTSQEEPDDEDDEEDDQDEDEKFRKAFNALVGYRDRNGEDKNFTKALEVLKNYKFRKDDKKAKASKHS
ncbi:uncharacterized protein BDZ99DRAFT_480163 [Mytilinidion resinicola]|uniref:Uncharacterized protein n=1 Tax=Mytilinidion resinicola TaxID=574789 RepID=A0A6A6YC67_9PEZI|nr:uncharacterized protein BDZ99DRAFT_480163 [Mytilinidion resinicola]KAF2805437.1 hypothetical protein BDZ99DRAFT_480163 [Mytilinidion resinicola]